VTVHGFDTVDLSKLRLSPGAGARLDVSVEIEAMEFASQRYTVGPRPLPVTLDVSRLNGPGFALRARFEAIVQGPCMRCLKPGRIVVQVESREVDAGGGNGGEPADSDPEMHSPYVTDEVLDVASWARDALIVGLPETLLCRDDCPGLCPVCAADLAEVGAGHSHGESPPDPRWAKLSEITLD
jgi:uncharacterized protein